MKKKLLISLLGLPFFCFSQWTKINNATSKKVKEEFVTLKEKQLFSLDKKVLKDKLHNAPMKLSGLSGVDISMPNSKGKLEKFKVWEYSNFTPEMQSLFPEIKSYVGIGVTDPTAYIRFSVSKLGISSSTLRSGGSDFVESYTQGNDVYAAYESSSRLKNEQDAFVCSTIDNIVTENIEAQNSNKSNNKVLKSFRIAFSAEGGYSQFHINRAGATNESDDEKKAIVVAAINNSLTRINGLYEKDLAVHFDLINILDVIYLDPATDPYVDNYNIQVQSTLTSVIGAANYDIGHVLVYDGPNGNAGCIGCICTGSNKGSAFTSHYIPVGDIFDIDYVAHEMGHQVGATHTHTYSGNEGAGVQVEPGSGNTIMAYTGITDNYDTQFNSNDFFTYRNIRQIQNNLLNKACAINTSLANDPPIVEAGVNVTIPISTPFVLKGNVTDPNGDSMTYVWEQNNPATAEASYGVGSVASPTKTNGPNFKMYPPISEPIRYFPEYTKILAGVNATKWEALSSVSRVLDFTLTARDNSPNGPQTNTDAIKVTVNSSAGPFIVTAPIFGESLNSKSSYNVKWNVANTNNSPVNTTKVNIKFSIDGGETFDVLAANTDNDGEEIVEIPAGSEAENAFFMVEAIDNIYFAMSPSFVIDYDTVGEDCKLYSYTGPAIVIPDAVGNYISSEQVEVPIQVGEPGVITSIRVKPNVQHANMSHLAIGLEGPMGTSVLFWNRTCPNRSNLTASFSEAGSTVVCTALSSGNYKPSESLAIFKGNQALGEWKLFVSDNTNKVQGELLGFDLEICTREVESNLAVNEGVFNSNNIKVYPNPSNGKFFIKTKDLGGEVAVTVFDMNGRMVHSSGFNGLTGETTNQVNINLNKGVYLLKLKSAKGDYTQKILIK